MPDRKNLQTFGAFADFSAVKAAVRREKRRLGRESPTDFLEVGEAIFDGFPRIDFELFLFDDEPFGAAFFTASVENGSPIDRVVGVGDRATVDVAVRFDVDALAAAREGGDRFGRAQFDPVFAHGVVRPPDVDLGDDARIAVVEERRPGGFFRVVDVEEVARVAVETDEAVEFRGFFGALAHFFGDFFIRFAAFANATFEAARDDQFVEAEGVGDFRAFLEGVALDRAEADVRAGRFEPDVVEHFAQLFRVILKTVITGEFDAFVSHFGDFFQRARDVLAGDVAERVELQRDRDAFFAFFVRGEEGRRGEGGDGDGAETGLQEGTTIHGTTFLAKKR